MYYCEWNPSPLDLEDDNRRQATLCEWVCKLSVSTQTILINGCAILVFGVSWWLLPAGCVFLCLTHSISRSIIVYLNLDLDTKFNSFCCIYCEPMKEVAAARYSRRASHIAFVWCGLECRLIRYIYRSFECRTNSQSWMEGGFSPFAVFFRWAPK